MDKDDLRCLMLAVILLTIVVSHGCDLREETRGVMPPRHDYDMMEKVRDSVAYKRGDRREIRDENLFSVQLRSRQ